MLHRNFNDISRRHRHAGEIFNDESHRPRRTAEKFNDKYRRPRHAAKKIMMSLIDCGMLP